MPSESIEHRRLAAIMFTDMVGYTALAQRQDKLALELLEGETLRHRIKHGLLPIDELLELASQIAGALAAAHAKDIVHRDIKPANIFLEMATEKQEAGREPSGRARTAQESRPTGETCRPA